MSEEKPIKRLIKSVFDMYQLSEKSEHMKLTKHWSEVVGEGIASRTERIYIKDRVLFVKVNSPALKHELQFHKDIILQKCNQFLTDTSINKIVIQ